MIKGYTDTALTVTMLSRQGGCFQRQKGEIASEGLSQQQLYLILEKRDGSKRRDRQKLRLKERKRGSVDTRGRKGNLDTIPG